MSGKPLDEHSANRELEAQFQYAIRPALIPIIQSLAEDLRRLEPAAPGDEFGVQPRHVQAAVARLVDGWLAPPGPTPPSEPFAFISYSHADADFVRELCAKIEQSGLRTWIDERSIRTGERWVNVLRKAIDDCTVCVIVLTRSALTSEWCRYEQAVVVHLDKAFIARRYVELDEIPPPLKDVHMHRLHTSQDLDDFVAELRRHFD